MSKETTHLITQHSEEVGEFQYSNNESEDTSSPESTDKINENDEISTVEISDSDLDLPKHLNQKITKVVPKTSDNVNELGIDKIRKQTTLDSYLQPKTPTKSGSQKGITNISNTTKECKKKMKRYRRIRFLESADEDSNGISNLNLSEKEYHVEEEVSKRTSATYQRNNETTFYNDELKKLFHSISDSSLDGPINESPLNADVQIQGGDVYVFCIPEKMINQTVASDGFYWRKFPKNNKKQPFKRTYYYLKCGVTDKYDKGFRKIVYELKENQDKTKVPIVIQYFGDSTLVKRRNVINMKTAKDGSKSMLLEEFTPTIDEKSCRKEHVESQEKYETRQSLITQNSFTNLIGLATGALKVSIKNIIIGDVGFMAVIGHPEGCTLAKRLLKTAAITKQTIIYDTMFDLGDLYVSGIFMNNTEIKDNPKFPVLILVHQKQSLQTHKRFLENYLVPILELHKLKLNVKILCKQSGLTEIISPNCEVLLNNLTFTKSDFDVRVCDQFEEDIKEHASDLKVDGIVLCCFLLQMRILLHFNMVYEENCQNVSILGLEKYKYFPDLSDIVSFVYSGNVPKTEKKLSGKMNSDELASYCLESNLVTFENIRKCYLIRSPSNGKLYLVKLENGLIYCSCNHPNSCYHVKAAILFRDQDTNENVHSEDGKIPHYGLSALVSKKRKKTGTKSEKIQLFRVGRTRGSSTENTSKNFTFKETQVLETTASEMKYSNVTLVHSEVKELDYEFFLCNYDCEKEFTEGKEHYNTLLAGEYIDGNLLNKAMIALLRYFKKEQDYIVLTTTVYQSLFITVEGGENVSVIDPQCLASVNEFIAKQNDSSCPKQNIVVLLPRTPGHSDHWMLGLVTENEISIYDSIENGSYESLLTKHFSNLNTLAREYFQKPYFTFVAKKGRIHIPWQKNSFDCGLYTLLYFNNVLKGNSEENWQDVESKKGRRWVYHLVQEYQKFPKFDDQHL